MPDDIGYMSLHLKAFSVEQKYRKPTNSLIDNNKQITNLTYVLKLWLLELLMSNVLRLQIIFVMTTIKYMLGFVLHDLIFSTWFSYILAVKHSIINLLPFSSI